MFFIITNRIIKTILANNTIHITIIHQFYFFIYVNRYDIFYFINPPEVKMEVSDVASYKLKEMMHNKYFSPFARLSYFIQYLYATKSFNEYDMSINKCHDISLKFKGCFVSFK